MNAGPKGWLPVDADVADPLPTIDAAAEVLRELALHPVAHGDPEERNTAAYFGEGLETIAREKQEC